jgi:Icc-related predicted phosphoesterase
VAGGDEPAQEQLGTTLVVCPGRLDRGNYAVVDFHKLSVEHVVAAEQTV